MKLNEKHIINDKIKFPEVRVVGEEGEQIGVMPVRRARDLASEQDLDLIVISDKSTPPVVRIANYSKFKYELDKKAKEIAKKNRANKVEIKEVGLRFNTDIHDQQRLQKRASEWLDHNSKVKINMTIKGRENNRKSDCIAFLAKFISEITNAKIEGKITDSSRGLTAILVNNSK